MKVVRRMASSASGSKSHRVSSIIVKKKTAARSTSGGKKSYRSTQAHGSSFGGVESTRNEETFKKRLLQQTIQKSVCRPSGLFALHIKNARFYDIDSQGFGYNSRSIISRVDSHTE